MLTVDLDRLELPAGARALDLGCGRGRHAHAIAARDGLEVVGVDVDGGELSAAAEGFALVGLAGGWSLLQGDALALPFKTAAFDAVVCSEVLEHLPDYAGALDEIARVTRPGGLFALSVPRGWPEAICWRLSAAYRTTPGGHVRIFNARELGRAVTDRGFAAIGRHGAHALHSPYWWLRCAVERTVGGEADAHPLVTLYRRLLEWDIRTRPPVLRLLEALLNPVLGKSVVMYFKRTDAPT